MNFRPLALTVLVSLSAVSSAKPWQGIEPGVSRRADVIKKFSEPSKVVPAKEYDVLVYLGPQAIKGTKQAQFRIDKASGTVDRIDVFPAPQIAPDAIETTFGAACPAGNDAAAATSDCYLKKLTDDFRTYFHYPRQGLTIFFKEDGKSVHSFVYQPPKVAR